MADILNGESGASARTKINNKSDKGHHHPIAEVDALQGALDGKAALAHNHPQSDIQNLVVDLADKAAAVHTHPQSEIDDLVTDLANKAPITSPTFLGAPKAPTAAPETDTDQIATTAFVKGVVAALIDGSPEALDTLVELAAALGDDPNFATTMTNLIAGKLAKAENLSDLADAPTALGNLGAAASSHNHNASDINAGTLPTARLPTVALRSDVDAALAAGYTVTVKDEGTAASGTFTPAPTTANIQKIINGGAFTFAAPSAAGEYTLIIAVTNSASAGAITFSGFTKQGGDALTVTNGHVFYLYITKLAGKVALNVQAMQ